ncbi:hypothetical protein Unana1_01918 [Umbelopsis nana]
MAVRLSSLDAGSVWLTLYFVLNLSLTLFNKAILNDFGFPWTLTAIHTLCGAIGSYSLCLAGLFTPAKLGDHENMVMVLFSVLYTFNIAISNVSLKLVSVPFHQVVRAMTPAFTVALSIMFLQKSYTKMIYFSLIPVVAGVAFATRGEYDYTLIGFLLTVLGTVLAAVKTIVTNRVQVGRLKLHPLDLLLRMSPLACIQTIIYAQLTGEMSAVREFAAENMSMNMLFGLIANGAVAFLLNVVSFTANKKTSALTMTVAGNVKQVLTIVLSVIIFNLRITPLNGVGILLTLAGGAWYTHVEMTQKSKHQTPILPTAMTKPENDSLLDQDYNEKKHAEDL